MIGLVSRFAKWAAWSSLICAIFASELLMADELGWQANIEASRLLLLQEEQDVLEKSLALSLEPGNLLLAKDLDLARNSLEQKQKAFHSVLNEKYFPPNSWEASLQKRLLQGSTPKSPNDPFLQRSLEYLQKQHPQAITYSPLEWENLKAIYGDQAYESFAKASFAATDSDHSFLTSFGPQANFELVVVALPAEKSLFPAKNTPAAWAGIEVTEFLVSSYSSINEQAMELSNYLQSRKSERLLILFSQGESSAVVNRYLDLQPGARKHPLIAAWINYNGKNFGPTVPPRAHALMEKKLARKLASAFGANTKLNRSEEQEIQWYSQIARDQAERKNRVLSLGPGFPIYTFVDSAQTAGLHEAFIPDAKNYVFKKVVPLESMLLRFFKRTPL